jgi:hypothetical protein
MKPIHLNTSNLFYELIIPVLFVKAVCDLSRFRESVLFIKLVLT